MGKARKMEREQAERQKKRKQQKNLILISASACILVALFAWLLISQQVTTGTISISPNANGDLHVPKNRLQNNLTYVDYGGTEELIFWNDGNAVRTAFDTCEECYSGGDIHFTLNNSTLTCSLCRTTLPVSTLGTAQWGGCQPVSIIPEIRSDTGAEIVIPAEVLAYARRMFSRWDASDFSISLETYQAAE